MTSSPSTSPFSGSPFVDFPPSSQPRQTAQQRVREQLYLEERAPWNLKPPAPFAGETAFEPSQVRRTRDYDSDDDDAVYRPDLVWTQPNPPASEAHLGHHAAKVLSSIPDSINSEASSLEKSTGTSGSTPRSFADFTDAHQDSAPFRASPSPRPAADEPRPADELSSAATLVGLSRPGARSSSTDAQVPKTPTTVITPMQADSSSAGACPTRDWSLKEELDNTPAHFYRGPLPPAQVLSHLSSPSISKNARLALTGKVGGYLQYFHFVGYSSASSFNTGSGKAKAVILGTSVASSITKERWQCRACHGFFTIPPDQVSNLGAHLYGTKKPWRVGCLDLRANDPAEAIVPPPRDGSGAIVRVRPDKPTSASRAPRGSTKPSSRGNEHPPSSSTLM
ncbi:hypothetical protein CF319_g7947 [Tilletia indica]|uniref:Uncharacterized protein n=1 Tax=Tilletia indica TaxID=43049 RepID=A0A177TXI4_9BASI|nr:hypothetical protein CF319_g7947 [Tilletia indica]KAE8244823.1 hypothetical protein A4X13_0g6232 [Tilletia indica]